MDKDFDYHIYKLKELILLKDCWSVDDAAFFLTDFEAENKLQESIELRILLDNSIVSGKLKPDHNNTHFNPDTIYKWAKEKKLPANLISCFSLANIENKVIKHDEAQACHAQNKHTSELLDILNHAVADIWENHDQKKLPTNEMIIQWLNDNYKDQPALSDSMKKSMCTIMRPLKYK